MSLNTSRARLAGLSKELARSWHETEDHWRDQKRAEFSQTYMQMLFDSVENAELAIDNLEKVLKKVRSDCELDL
ncbi:MAG: hypothetical protein AAF226_18985 [Verrucomicrobiota bacterium]